MVDEVDEGHLQVEVLWKGVVLVCLFWFVCFGLFVLGCLFWFGSLGVGPGMVGKRDEGAGGDEDGMVVVDKKSLLESLCRMEGWYSVILDVF